MTEKPQILPLGLLKERFLSDINAQLFSAIRSCAHLWPIVETKSDFRRRMRASNPSAVLVIDSAITKPEYSKVLSQLVEYAKSGGKVICACNFSNNLVYDDALGFFNQWGLSWDAGSYLRTTVHRNTSADTIAGISEDSFKKLPVSYSIKSLSLLHVSPNHAIYNPSSSSHIESRVFPSDYFPVDPLEAPCAFAPVGRGYFGYIGDVNSEEGSSRVVMAMAGLSVDAVVSVPRDSNGYGVTIGPDGSFSPSNVRDKDPNRPVMYSDCLRQAGQSIVISNRMGTEGDEFLGPSRPSTSRASPAPSGASTSHANFPPRPREAEVKARAVKRAANSERKHQKAESLKEKGNDLFKKGDNIGAINYYESAIAVRPQPTYYTNIAAARLKLEDYRAAEDACSQALLHDPQNIKARYRRGVARRNQLKFLDAVRDFKSCAKRVPQDPQFREAMVCTRELSDEHKAAEDDSNGSTLHNQYVDDEDILLDARKERFARPIEHESDSDSSDFEHQGNGTPCRFHNGNGCKYGAKECRFKHAPDKEKATRDELGRNVCNFYLMGICKFGDRCHYAHSREYLPKDGWWCLWDPVRRKLDLASYYNTHFNSYEDDDDFDYDGFLERQHFTTMLEDSRDYEDMLSEELTPEEREAVDLMMAVRLGLI